MGDYPLFAKNITLSFDCPQCNHAIAHCIESLPSPNWDGDTIDTSQNMESYDFECPNCHKEFEADVYANIYYGELAVHAQGDWREIDGVRVSDEWEDSSQFQQINEQKTDLGIFLANGKDFQTYLEQLVWCACYYSYHTNAPFAVEDIIEERDDYRYSFLRGYFSAICSIRTDQRIDCIKVIPFRYFGNRTYYACRFVSGELLSEQNIPVVAQAMAKDNKLLDSYFRAQKTSTFTKTYQESLISQIVGLEISQTSLNDDIMLYCLKYASIKGLHSLPIDIISENTPFYDIVEAYGFSTYLQQQIGEQFRFDATHNKITDIHINEHFLKDFTRNKLKLKYESNYMYIDSLFDAIESKINDII